MQIQTQEPRFFNRLKVLDGERTVMALNLGGETKDLFLMRPCVHPLYTPAGLPVTEMGAHNFPHHKGVWLGHAQVNGVNFFHDLADAGWIVPVRVSSDADAERARIDLDLEWRDRRGTVVATETRPRMRCSAWGQRTCWTWSPPCTPRTARWNSRWTTTPGRAAA